MAEQGTIEPAVVAEPSPGLNREVRVVGSLVEAGTPSPSSIEVTVHMVGSSPVDLVVTETNADGEKIVKSFRATPEGTEESPPPMIPGREPWRWKNPSFQDKEVFAEYMQILEDNRNAMFPDEDDEA